MRGSIWLGEPRREPQERRPHPCPELLEGPAQVTRRNARRVFINRLEVMASVGIFEFEKRYEQRIHVTIELDVVDSYDGQSDRLDDVLDYGSVIDGVRNIVSQRHFNLIETIAERIAEACLADARVDVARVAIAKPDIVPGCAEVGIAIERRRLPG